MIKRLVVKGLNHRADGTHDLEFHPDLNIFTGPNGSGKTTLLKLIWYLISGNLERVLAEIPFQFVSVETDVLSLDMAWVDNQKWDSTLQFDGQHPFGESKVELKWQFTGGEESSETLAVDSETGAIRRADVAQINALNKRIAQTTKSSIFFPTFRRIEGGFSSISRELDELSMRFLTSAPEMLQHSMSQFSTEMSVNGHKFVASISTDDLGELLTQKYADIYEEISGLQSRVLTDISKKIENSAGKADASETQMPQDVTSVVNAIKQADEQRDLLRKPFSVLSDLTRQLLQHQAIRVTGQVASGERTDGITLGAGKDGITLGEAKEAISSDKLSAGEKQMLSFLCYNAFSDNSAIFIDEPELSLHGDWQRLLLPVLLQQQTGNQFFVATHSPFIYAKYPDKDFFLGKTHAGGKI
ncbi:hypothetical protein C6495_07620 [Candidatus Poribacteria bacterium]|nr:MAG: hypothetical protein C6495_07620 [Candidatus Poribacteria bacterium]